MDLNVVRIDLIKDFIKTNNLSITKFCKLCKISPSTLYKIFNGKDFIIVALYKIARVMRLKIWQLIRP